MNTQTPTEPDPAERFTADIDQLPEARPSSEHGQPHVWIMQVPVISTVHLPRAVFESLPSLMTVAYLGGVGGQGAMLMVDEDSEDSTTGEPALDKMLAYLAGKGYSYVRLDPDGDVIGALERFLW